MKDGTKDYDKFLEEATFIANNAICPECNSSYIIHTSPFAHSLLCGDCGTSFNVTIKKEEE